MPVGNAVQHSQGLRERGYSMATGGFFNIVTGSVAAQNSRFGQFVDTSRNHLIVCGQLGDIDKSNAGETQVWYRHPGDGSPGAAVWKFQQRIQNNMASSTGDRSAGATITELTTGGSAGSAYAAVAHPYDDDQASNAGTITIHEKSCLLCDWIQMATLLDPVSETDTMGLSGMSLVGDTLAVSHALADLDKDGANSKTSRGRVNIYTREGVTGAGVTGAVWASQQVLDSGDNTTSAQLFGRQVRLNKTNNNLLAVSGVKLATDAGTTEGHVKVFERSGTTWSLKATLKASDVAAGDLLGCGASTGRGALSFCGDTIVAGASGQDEDVDGNNTVSQAGMAYVFRALTGDYSQWTEVAKLTGPTRVANDRFGDSVTHWQSGDQLRIAVGAFGSELNGDDANDLTSSGTFANDGAVMIFQNTRDNIFECVSIIKRHNASSGVTISSGRGTVTYAQTFSMGSLSMNDLGILVVGSMNDTTDEDGVTQTAINNGSACFYHMDWGVHTGEFQ